MKDNRPYIECPVCGAKVAYSEKLYVIPFYTLDTATKSFSVVAKGVCWECFRGHVMHGDDYKPSRPCAGRTDKEGDTK